MKKYLIVLLLIVVAIQGYGGKRYALAGTWSWTGTNITYWSATPCGGGGATVPGLSDTAYFSCAGSSVITITSPGMSIMYLDLTGFTGTLNLNSRGLTTRGCNLATTTSFGTGNISLAGTGTLLCSPNTLSCGFIINGSTINLGSHVNISANFNVSAGTFNSNNYNITCKIFSTNTVNARILNLGTSVITLTNGTGAVLNLSTLTNATINASNATLVFNTNLTGTETIYLGSSTIPVTWGKVWVRRASASYFHAFSGTGSTVKRFIVEAGCRLTFGTGTYYITDSLRFNGTSGSRVFIQPTATGSQVFISSTIPIGCGSDYVTNNNSYGWFPIAYSGSSTGYLGANSTYQCYSYMDCTGWGWVYGACAGGTPTSSISKLNGVTQSAISKINSVTKATTKKVNGVINQ